MKKIILFIVIFLVSHIGFACPACEKQQPKILRGIAHGAGPEGNMDYVIVWATVIITVLTLIFAVKWLIKPGETEENHIKRTFLTFE
ncbi:MAG: hypothetical protein U5N85_14820 [Arcicella sp.]|nr:hypothetical protein [Arcicella sp.]